MATKQALQFQLTAGIPPAMRAWQRLIEVRHGHLGISSACIAPLLMIGRADDNLRQVELARQLGMKGPSLVRLLDKLAEADLIRRESDASDSRANRLRLTAAGQGLHRKLEQGLIELRHEVLDKLTTAELQAVLKLYKLLDDAVALLDR